MLKFDVEPRLADPGSGLNVLTERVAAACRHAGATKAIPGNQVARDVDVEASDAIAMLDMPRNGAETRSRSSAQGVAGSLDFEEALRLLALNVCNRAKTQQLQTILVMGAYPGDGRTTVVGNLGLALASLGSRVIVIASDFRKLDLPDLLRVEFAEPEDGHLPPAQVAASYKTGMTVVRLTSPANEGGDKSALLTALLAELRPLADFIILDSPPCLAWSDAFFLAPLADSVLYVVRRRKQNVDAQRNIQVQLAGMGVNVLGVVYNEGKRFRPLQGLKRKLAKTV
jgi:Mrp family chromosome partitioning ATPase